MEEVDLVVVHQRFLPDFFFKAMARTVAIDVCLLLRQIVAESLGDSQFPRITNKRNRKIYLAKTNKCHHVIKDDECQTDQQG